MRVAIFTETFHQINGVAMVYNRFARWCAERGYEIEIFTPGPQAPIVMGSVVINSIDMIAPIPYYRNLSFDLFPLRRSVERYFEEHPFDLVHIATQGHMGILALVLADKFKLPKISCYHTAIPEYAYERFIKALGNNFLGRPLARGAHDLCWWFQRKLLRSSSLILVPTKSIREMLEREVGVPTAYFTRGVDSDAYTPAKRTRPAGEHPVTLYAGRVSIEKNLQLLRSLDLSGGRDLVVVGDGPYTETLRAAQPQARFTGFLTGADLQQAYADADIFVFPSKTDTFGNAVLEAMASGLPVIVTDVLGPKDFVRHGETGFVASGDEEFVAYHRRLVQDHTLRAQMGRNARAYALTCSWDAIFEEQLIGNYRRVIDGY